MMKQPSLDSILGGTTTKTTPSDKVQAADLALTWTAPIHLRVGDKVEIRLRGSPHSDLWHEEELASFHAQQGTVAQLLSDGKPSSVVVRFEAADLPDCWCFDPEELVVLQARGRPLPDNTEGKYQV